ncbi:MAG: hypothetical protein WAS27_00580 [Candidatus Saccharimonadales bacterium]
MATGLVTLSGTSRVAPVRLSELFPPTSRPETAYTAFDRLSSDRDRRAFGEYLTGECGFTLDQVGLNVRNGIERAYRTPSHGLG